MIKSHHIIFSMLIFATPAFCHGVDDNEAFLFAVIPFLLVSFLFFGAVLLVSQSAENSGFRKLIAKFLFYLPIYVIIFFALLQIELLSEFLWTIFFIILFMTIMLGVISFLWLISLLIQKCFAPPEDIDSWAIDLKETLSKEPE